MAALKRVSIGFRGGQVHRQVDEPEMLRALLGRALSKRRQDA